MLFTRPSSVAFSHVFSLRPSFPGCIGHRWSALGTARSSHQQGGGRAGFPGFRSHLLASPCLLCQKLLTSLLCPLMTPYPHTIVVVILPGFNAGLPGCFQSVNGVQGQSCSILAQQYGLGAIAPNATAALLSINPNVTVCSANDTLLVDSVCVGYGEAKCVFIVIYLLVLACGLSIACRPGALFYTQACC